MNDSNVRRVVLAYSGGLDTSVMLHWLKRTFDCEVYCYTADVGQGAELEGLPEKARAAGAEDILIEDLREEFAADYVFPAVQANAVYEGVYLMGTSLARPLIARRQCLAARRLGADAVAHGATGKGNDQVRFELTIHALAPELTIIAPWRTWEFKSRSDLLAYAAREGIAVTASAEKPYSMDANLMHISYEGGILEEPWNAPPEDMFQWTRSPENAKPIPQTVTIAFVKGVPTAVDGQSFKPAALVEHLNSLGAAHGIGRVDVVENRFVGMKSRGVYETPGVTILQAAHRALESITLDREVMHLRDSLGTRISECIYYGFWHSPEFELLRGMISQTQENVSGEVRLRLYRGNVTVTGRRAPRSLYSSELATFEADSVYDQRDAEGFIRLNALRLRMRALLGGPSAAPGPENGHGA